MPSWVEHYPGPEMLTWFQTYKDLGFRVASIAAWGPSSHAGYTAVFLPVSGPDQHLHLDVSMYDVAGYLAFEADQGFFPTQIAGTCGRGSQVPPCYALVFERQAQPPTPQRDVHLFYDWTNVVERLRALHLQDGNVLSVDAFPSAGTSTKYCLIVDRSPKAREQWKVDRWTNLAGAIANHPKHLAMRRTWSLPRAAVPITHEPKLPSTTFSSDRLLSLWKTETLGAWPDLTATDADGFPPGDFDGGIKAYGPFDQAELGQFNFSLNPDWWVIYVGAYGSGGVYPIRYAALIAATGSYYPLARTFKASVATYGQVEITSADLDLDDLFAHEPVDPAVPDPSPPLDAKPRRRWPRKGGEGPGDDIVQPEPTALPQFFSEAQAKRARPKPWLDWMKRTMTRHGARMGHLVVARSGAGKIALACTLAEPGYTEPEHHHKLRVGSVSKFLTGMAAMRYWGANNGLYTPVATALGLNFQTLVNAALLSQAITIDGLLRHRTGFGGGPADIVTASWGADQIAAANGVDAEALVPGAFTPFLERYAMNLLAPPKLPDAPLGGLPGFQYVYNNMNFGIAGEVISKASLQQNAIGYEGAMWSFWGALNQLAPLRPHLVERTAQRSFELNEPPCHEPIPSYSGNLLPTQYDFDARWYGAAGEWALSILDLVQIVSRMDPTVTSPILTENEFNLFTEPIYGWSFGGSPPSIVDPNGRGCYLTVGQFPFPSFRAGGRLVNRWSHNGSTNGGCGNILHLVPAYDEIGGGSFTIVEPAARTPSITIGVAFNSNNLGASDASMAELVQIAANVEKAGYWPDGDLFQQT